MVILLLCLHFLSSGQILVEMVKVANLLEHFQMHRSRGEVSDLYGFIRMHYFDPEHRRSDPGHHARLPLQQISSNPIPVFHPQTHYISIASLEPPATDLPVAREAHHTVFAGGSDIFQPPRIVC
jgi:hypothetical protein